MLVVEAESTDTSLHTHSGNTGVGQIKKYLEDWNASYTGGILAGPYTERKDILCMDSKYHCHGLGLISCDDQGNLVFKKPSFKPANKRTLENLEIMRNLEGDAPEEYRIRDQMQPASHQRK